MIDKGLDLLLIDPPMVYPPMMPNGLSQVYNCLKPLEIKMQAIDLNILFFHASKRPDLWTVVSAFDLWNKPEWVQKHCQPSIGNIAKEIVEAKPKLVGISGSETSQPFASELIKAIRGAAPEIIILAGGYNCEYHYDAPFLYPDFDYMIIREAEVSLPPLVRSLLDGNRPYDLPGVLSCYDTLDREWVAAPILLDLDSIGFPKYEWTIPLQHYPGAAPILMSRGCGWGRCYFCNECFDYRIRDPFKVADEMEWLVSQGKQGIFFGDASLNSDHDRFVVLCKEIIKRQLPCRFNGQYHISKHNGDFNLIQEAGCANLTFGIDGWNNNVLKLINKGYTMAMVEETLKSCHQAGISTSVNMVIGTPGETEDDIDECIENIVRLKDYITNFQNLNVLLLGAGSIYYLEPERFGIEFKQGKSEAYRKSPHIVPEELWSSRPPYIDAEVRQARRLRIADAIIGAGINLTDYARWQAKIQEGIMR